MNSEVNGVLAAAHDLKSPLGILRQLALSLEFADTPAERARLQAQMVNVAERALRQVNDLTKVARLEDGLFALEPVGVRGICDEVSRELAPAFQTEERRLRLVFSNRQRLAIANRELLHSIIYNLCTNALRYSDRSTSSILAVSDSGGRIRIDVRDFGPTLPVAIWRSFQNGGLSAPASIAMRPGSSGLGLYVASEFARSMRAEVGAIRHRDGTSFFVDLPVSKQASLF